MQETLAMQAVREMQVLREIQDRRGILVTVEAVVEVVVAVVCKLPFQVAQKLFAQQTQAVTEVLVVGALPEGLTLGQLAAFFRSLMLLIQTLGLLGLRVMQVLPAQ